jgi:hypothetical protein
MVRVEVKPRNRQRIWESQEEIRNMVLKEILQRQLRTLLSGRLEYQLRNQIRDVGSGRKL